MIWAKYKVKHSTMIGIEAILKESDSTVAPRSLFLNWNEIESLIENGDIIILHNKNGALIRGTVIKYRIVK